MDPEQLREKARLELAMLKTKIRFSKDLKPSQQSYKCRDGFNIETNPNRRIEGFSYHETTCGFFLKNFASLIEDELYIYNNENDEKYNKMYIISGAYVKQLPKRDITTK